MSELIRLVLVFFLKFCLPWLLESCTPVIFICTPPPPFFPIEILLVVMHPHTKYHWPISKDKNVMAQKRKYYLKNNYLTLRSKVKTVCDTPPYDHAPIYQINTIYKTIIWPRGESPTKVITVCDTPPYGHAPTYQIALTHLERQKCYGPDKKILFKKQLFDLEVIMVCNTTPYGHAPTYQI
jgi:hypothetical protein